MGPLKRALAAALAALLTASPAGACPLCQLSSSGSLRAYFGATMLLSLLPLGIAGGIALWLKRAGRKARAASRIE